MGQRDYGRRSAPERFAVIDNVTGAVVARFAHRTRADARAERLDSDGGGFRFYVRPLGTYASA
jgi:hypothetical protein